MKWTARVNYDGTGAGFFGIKWMPIAPNIVVPDRFTAEGEIDGYRVSMVLESDFGVVECVHLSIEAADAMEMWEARERGERRPMKVTGEALRRIPVNYLVKEAVRQVMAEQDEGHALTFMGGPEAIPPVIMAEWPDGDVDVVLRYLVSVYRRAAAIGDPPNKAVQEATGWSRATVGRALKLARERGIMGDDERGFGNFGGPRPRVAAEVEYAGDERLRRFLETVVSKRPDLLKDDDDG